MTAADQQLRDAFDGHHVEDLLAALDAGAEQQRRRSAFL
jgi:hypothetical protein